MSKFSATTPSGKKIWIAVLGWGLLAIGVFLYIVPAFYEWLGHQSGLFAFILIFIGITLLKYRKDQLNR